MKILLALCAAAVGYAEEVKLEPRWSVGEKYEVSEESLIDSKTRATVKGINGDPSAKTSGTGKYIEHKERAYVEEVLESAEGHLKLTRKYSNSIKESLKPSGEKKESERTALIGKTVTIERDGASQKLSSDRGPVLGDDANDATFVDQIISLLPSRSVKVGDSWEVDASALGKAIFHEGYNPSLMHTSGRGMLKEVTGRAGDRVAKIALEWSVKLDKAGAIPGIEYHLTGVASFHVDHGRFLSLDASGPVALDVTEGGGHLDLEGTFRATYRARPEK